MRRALIAFLLLVSLQAPAWGAAFTSTVNGNWSSTATWGGVGPPGAGDTVTIATNVTVDVDTTVGSSPATGGTAAITVPDPVEGKTLTVAAGKTLTVLGDLALFGANIGLPNTLSLSAGASVVLKPPSGQQYKINCAYHSANGRVVAGGTSGSHCTIKTDKSLGGLAGYVGTNLAGDFATQGLVTADYCDFVDMGTSSVFGVQTYAAYPVATPVNISVTNCTFTRSSYSGNYSGEIDGGYSWDGNSTFSGNTFTSSVVVAGDAGARCFQLSGNDVPATSGNRVVSGNRFDLLASFGQTASWKYQYNVFAGTLNPWVVEGTWTKPWAQFDTNFAYYGTVPSQPAGLSGDCTNTFFVVDNPGGSNNHVTGFNPCSGLATYNHIGNIFSCNNVGNNPGHWFFTPGSPSVATVWNIKNNIVLPKADNTLSATLVVSLGDVSNLTINVDHNTACVEADALVWVGHLQTTVGQPVWGSVSGNLAWGTDATSQGYVVQNPDTTSLVDLVAPSAVRNNGKFHVNTTPSGLANSGNGYNLALSAAAGGSDVSGDPQFVDRTRNIKTWGVTKGLVAPTETQVLAYLQDPSHGALATLLPDLLAHVRGGFRPRAAAYKGASYAGDPSTTDAAGNAWPGATPDIGAMAWTPAATVAPKRLPYSSRGRAVIGLRREPAKVFRKAG